MVVNRFRSALAAALLCAAACAPAAAAAAERVSAADVLDAAHAHPGLTVFDVELDLAADEMSDRFQTPKTEERVVTRLDERILHMQCVRGRQDGRSFSVELAMFYDNRSFYYKVARTELEPLFKQRLRVLEAKYGEPLRQRPEGVTDKQLETDVNQPGDKVQHYFWVSPQRPEVLYLAYNETRNASAQILFNPKAYERAFAESKERLDDHNRYLQGKDKVHK